MAKPHSMPDPKDRSVNSPSYIASAAQVLGYYNAHNKGEKKERVVGSVKDWYIDKAKKEGWEKATFHGSDCLLEVTVALKEK
ncbi:hypothetical protein [Alcanivorax sp.]|uniref:hypothetical protein n=1 Tax=Alcanivorax sp. TaxID=1872427 RepID=UPI0025BE0594|nr:hypothetical protein [Alcanivorax sp.]